MNPTRNRLTLSQRLPTLLLILATTAGATFTILLAGGSGSLEALGARVIYDTMAALALIPWLVIAIFRPSWRPTSRLAPILLICIAVFAVSSIASRVPRLSFEMLGYAVLLAELYLLLVALLRRTAIRLHFERLSLTMCVIVCVLYLAQAFQAWLVWWAQVGHLAIPPLRPGYLGLSLGAPIPIATLVLILGAFGLVTSQLRGRTNQIVISAVVVLVGATVLITASRGAWIGAAAGIIIAFIAAIVARPVSRAVALQRLRSRSTAVALVIGVPVFTVGAILAGLSGRLTLDDGGYRAGFAAASARMFESSPMTGTGPGTWQVLRAVHSEATSPDLYIPHAHNIYLQTLAEFGVLGVIAGLIFVGGVVRLAVRAIRSDTAERRHVGYAAIFTIVLLLVQQIGDVLMNVPALLFAMALPIAWLDAASLPGLVENPDDAPKRSIALNRAFPVVAAALTVVVLFGLARVESITGSGERGVAAAAEGDWAEAATNFSDAAAADPDLAVYQFELGISSANAGDLRSAEVSLGKSAAADDFPYAWLNLAAVRWKLGDVSGAKDALARAERLGLQRTSLVVAAGWLHQQLGDEPAATADYALAISQSPTLAADPFWSSASGPPGGLAAVLQTANQQASPSTKFQIDLVLDRLDDAQAELASFRASKPELYDLIIPAWTGDPRAWDAVQEQAASHPMDGTTVGWARLVASHLGDQAAVDRYGIWLSIVGVSDSGLPVTARIVTGSAEPLPAYVLDRYGSLYRRQLPQAQVVNLLPQVVLGDRL